MPFPNAGFEHCPGSRVACRQKDIWDDFAREEEAGGRGSHRRAVLPYKGLYTIMLLIILHLLHHPQC